MNNAYKLISRVFLLDIHGIYFTDVDECDLNVCPLNTSKSCINACGSFYCVCTTGWTGELCLEGLQQKMHTCFTLSNLTKKKKKGSYYLRRELKFYCMYYHKKYDYLNRVLESNFSDFRYSYIVSLIFI